MSPGEIGDLWLSEMSLLQKRGNTTRKDWNIHANSDYGPVNTVQAFQVICEAVETWVQYMLSGEHQCLLSGSPSLGEHSPGKTAEQIVNPMK